MFDVLYCHIGSGKTGTSSIQGTFFRNSEALRRFGMHYVRRPGGLLAHVADDPARVAQVRRRGMAEPQIGRFAARAVTALRDGAADAQTPAGLISTEHMMGLSGSEMDRLAALLRSVARQVRVVFYVRHPWSRIPSLLAQNVKTGAARLDVRLTNYVESYERALTPWMDRFGKDAIVLRAFDVARMPERSPVADICHAIGVPEAFDAIEPHAANPGLSAAATLIADALNGALRRERLPAGPREYLFELGGGKFTLPAEALRALKPQIDRELAWLEREFGFTLAEPRLPEHVADRNAIFSDEALDTIALTLNRQSVEIARLREDLRALKKRQARAGRTGAGPAPGEDGEPGGPPSDQAAG